MADIRATTGNNADEKTKTTPWHLKLLVVVLVLYLIYRLIQLMIWLVGKVF